jgi:hypothetical protein
MKFHVSTAMRTAVSTHVAEILRDVGPKVMSYVSIHLQHGPTFLSCRENMSEKSPSPPRFTVESWVRITITDNR